MTMINGNFDEGGGWSLQQGAQISGAYGSDSSPNSLVLEANHSNGLGSFAYQWFEVVAGQKLTGKLMLHRQQVPDYDTTFEVLWNFVPVYTMNAFSMTLGLWIPFEVPFSSSEEKEFRMNLDIGNYSPPWVPYVPPQHRFLVDSLALSTLGEASMIAESLMKWIDTEGLGTEGTDLFCSHMPDKPDNCVVVYDESSPSLDMSQALALDRFGIEIRVRDSVYESARDLIIDIHKALVGFSGLLAPSTPEVVMVDPMTSPTFLERDDSKRSIWTAHYALTVQSSGDQYRS